MKKVGKQSIIFDTPPTILETASIVGPKEMNGPLAQYFDKTLEDEFWGEESWEKAESKFVKETGNAALSKSGLSSEQIDYCFSGDLLNQCISSTFGLRDSNIPFFRNIWCLFNICRRIIIRCGFCRSKWRTKYIMFGI